MDTRKQTESLGGAEIQREGRTHSLEAHSGFRGKQAPGVDGLVGTVYQGLDTCPICTPHTDVLQSLAFVALELTCPLNRARS